MNDKMKVKTKIAIKIILLAYKWIETEYRTDIFISNLIKTKKRGSTMSEEIFELRHDARSALERRVYMQISSLNKAESDLDRLKSFFEHSNSECKAILKLISNAKK